MSIVPFPIEQETHVRFDTTRPRGNVFQIATDLVPPQGTSASEYGCRILTAFNDAGLSVDVQHHSGRFTLILAQARWEAYISRIHEALCTIVRRQEPLAYVDLRGRTVVRQPDGNEEAIEADDSLPAITRLAHTNREVSRRVYGNVVFASGEDCSPWYERCDCYNRYSGGRGILHPGGEADLGPCYEGEDDLIGYEPE